MMIAACSALFFAGLLGADAALREPPAPGEGEDLVGELADRVLDWKQELLAVPYKIEMSRDTGYVGELPTLPSAKCAVKLSSLSTGREQQGFPPDVLIGAVAIEETGVPAQPPSGFRFGASEGAEEVRHLNGVINPAKDLVLWQWQRQRHGALREWLGHWVTRSSGKKLAIIHSNGDMLYGGCTENTIIFKYKEIIKAQGNTAKIVFGAEVSPYPSDLGQWYEMKTWTDTKRSATNTDLGMPAGWAATYANCTGALNSVCASPAKYQYANAGFIMGPVGDLYNMFEEFKMYTGEENRMVNEYYLKNPSTVALDYAGELVMSLHNMVKDGQTPVEVKEKEFVKKDTQGKVCFVHGNGNSFPTLKTLAQQLK